jgi:hypothetical protein
MSKREIELNRKFSKEEIQMSFKYRKKFSTSLAIKEMQIKTTLRLHLSLVRMGIIITQTTNASEDTGNRNSYPLSVRT